MDGAMMSSNIHFVGPVGKDARTRPNWSSDGSPLAGVALLPATTLLGSIQTTLPSEALKEKGLI